MADTTYRDAEGLTVAYADIDLPGKRVLPQSAPSDALGAPLYAAGDRPPTKADHVASTATLVEALADLAEDVRRPVLQAGSTGADFSKNAASVPAGSALVTIPATPGRAYVEVQNQSADMLQLVRDDGAGGNATSILLVGVGAGKQGGGWSSATFKGRVRVFGPAGAQVAAYQE